MLLSGNGRLLNSTVCLGPLQRLLGKLLVVLAQLHRGKEEVEIRDIPPQGPPMCLVLSCLKGFQNKGKIVWGLLFPPRSFLPENSVRTSVRMSGAHGLRGIFPSSF